MAGVCRLVRTFLAFSPSGGTSMIGLESISSSIGVATGGATLAGAIFLASGSLEKGMRNEAKKQIAAFLQTAKVDYNVGHASELVRQLFLATFGNRHLSFLCIRRSITATIIFVSSISLLMYLKHSGDVQWPALSSGGKPIPHWVILLWLAIRAIPLVIVLGIIPDYLSLAKSRVILRWMTRRKHVTSVVALILLDLILSYFIAMIIYYGIHLPVQGLNGVCETYRYFEDKATCGDLINPLRLVWVIVTISSDMLWEALHTTRKYGLDNIVVFALGISTVLTSVWTILVLAAVSLLRLGVGLNLALGAARWAFDLEKHAVRIIGAFVAGIVWIGSIVYGVI
jgi:hypothetical protein